MCKIKMKSKEKKQYIQVPARFIERYMSDASSSHLKVYLHLLHFLSDSGEVSIAELADRCDFAERDVLRALRFWEKKQVLEFRLKPDGTLQSLDLFDLADEPEEGRITICTAPKPSDGKTGTVQAALPSSREAGASDRDTSASAYGASDRAASAYGASVEGASLSGSAEDRLCDHLESISGATVSREMVELIDFLIQELSFEEELVRYLLDYSYERIGLTKSFSAYVEKIALSWNSKGILTVEAAQAETAQFRSAFSRVHDIFGMTSPLTKPQQDIITRWSDELGFSLELIEEACTRAARQTHPSLTYCTRILEKWHAKGINTMEKVREEDFTFESQKQNVANSGKLGNIEGGRTCPSAITFTSYPQRDYSAEEWAEIERIMQARE